MLFLLGVTPEMTALSLAWRQGKRVWLVVVAGTRALRHRLGSRTGCHRQRVVRANLWGASMASNNSFKPNLLRYTNNMAGKACHVVGSAT